MNFFWVLGLVALSLGRWVYGFELVEWNVTEVAYQTNGFVSSSLFVGLTLIPWAVSRGAVCMDGSPPGYHLHHGFGSGANNWLVNLEGGGWCNDLRTCIYRKKTRRGSSYFMEKEIPFTGIMSDKPGENPGVLILNPSLSLHASSIYENIFGIYLKLTFILTVVMMLTDFYNWNRVKIRYCDGASFTGEGYNGEVGLFFRGQRIWQVAMEELMSKGMRYANQALLSGCSAGGLATIQHCDEFRALFSRSTKVKCLADAGMFLDAVDIAGGRTLRSLFGGVVNLQGSGKNLPRTCTSRMDGTSCFFPQNVVANIRTPTFILNTAYDVWQLQQSLAPARADPHGYWKACKLNYSDCNAGQIRFLQRFRNQMLNAVKGFSMSGQNGLFINSCFAHCQMERQDTWYAYNGPQIGNKNLLSLCHFVSCPVSLSEICEGNYFFKRSHPQPFPMSRLAHGVAKAVGDWYFDRSAVKAIDCPYPCDRTCHNLVFRSRN